MSTGRPSSTRAAEAVPARGAEPAGTSRETVLLRHGDHQRAYLLQRPGTSTATAVPLLVELPGRGIDAAAFDRLTGLGALAGRERLALAIPSPIGAAWNDGRYRRPRHVDDVGYLAGVIDDVAARLPVDRRRVYLVGMSNGATMAGRFACERPELIAGMVQVAGTAAAWLVDGCRPAAGVPLLQIHGTGDRYAPYAGGRRRGILARLVLLGRSAGPSVGVDDWARMWVAANRADPQPSQSVIPPDTTIRRWRDASGAPVVACYRVEGGGHTWPGSPWPLPAFLVGRTTQSFDATRIAWDFLAAHARET